MFISSISLRNFRIYKALDLTLRDGPSIFYGDNAQGKSNLLEACALLSGHSYRTEVDSEFINWESLNDPLPFTRVSASISKPSGNLKLDVIIQLNKSEGGVEVEKPRTQKRVQVNGSPKRWNALMGKLNAVSFTAQDIDIITGAPALRRRYLDIALSQTSPSYVEALSEYTKVLTQRNHLLKLIQEGRNTEKDLDFWNGKLMESGSIIICERLETIKQWNILIEPVHASLSAAEDHFSINYLPSVAPVDGVDLMDIKKAFEKELALQSRKEMAIGMTTVGPHRDDFMFMLNGKNLASFGSRGQQRTGALALKLTEASYIRDVVKDKPVMLLDDILAELDEKRRRHLLQTVSGYSQILMTSTDLDRFDDPIMRNAAKFRIQNGKVEQY
ncbi:MAG: DNA replication/repair protein RecF [Dehalococcoidia bacterium]|nr:DNA replication/repair protein RecF [Dehalococcoidia bacterium]